MWYHQHTNYLTCNYNNRTHTFTWSWLWQVCDSPTTKHSQLRQKLFFLWHELTGVATGAGWRGAVSRQWIAACIPERLVRCDESNRNTEYSTKQDTSTFWYTIGIEFGIISTSAYTRTWKPKHMSNITLQLTSGMSTASMTLTLWIVSTAGRTLLIHWNAYKKCLVSSIRIVSYGNRLIRN